MPNVISQIATQLPQPTLPQVIRDAGNVLCGLVEASAYVGEVVSLGYSEAILQIHDFHRQQVGGIPALCFLLATRVNPQTTLDARVEDASLILLRVMDQADLPNAEEAKRVRVENAQRVSGEIGVNWDDRTVMDATTHNLLSYAGVRCRVIGTFYMNDAGSDSVPNWWLCFGSDISNYYPNRGLKVFKPRGEVLSRIVNFRDPQIYAGVRIPMVQIGHPPSLNAAESYGGQAVAALLKAFAHFVGSRRAEAKRRRVYPVNHIQTVSIVPAGTRFSFSVLQTLRVWLLSGCAVGTRRSTISRLKTFAASPRSVRKFPLTGRIVGWKIEDGKWKMVEGQNTEPSVAPRPFWGEGGNASTLQLFNDSTWTTVRLTRYKRTLI